MYGFSFSHKPMRLRCLRNRDGTRIALSELDTAGTRSGRTSNNHNSGTVRQPMKTGNQSFRAAFFAKRLALSLGLATALAAPATSRAASATWTGTADAIWSNVNDWTASPVPGVNDTATFSNTSGNTNIDLSAGVTISNIVFDTSSA